MEILIIFGIVTALLALLLLWKEQIKFGIFSRGFWDTVFMSILILIIPIVMPTFYLYMAWEDRKY